MAASSRKACCRGCRWSPTARPSMVVTSLFPTTPICVRQERLATPSMRTVHAPHWPSPQPYLVPVRSSWSRRTLSKVHWESASILRTAPFTFICVIFVIKLPARRAGFGDVALLSCGWLWARVENFLSFVLWKLRRFLYFVQNRVEIVVLKGSGSMKEGLNYRERGSSSMQDQDCGQGGTRSVFFFDALQISLIHSRKKSSTLRE